MADRLTELLQDVKKMDLFPLLAGAIAVSKSWSLLTDKLPIVMTISKLQEEGLDSVPDRFRPAIEQAKICQGPILPYSEDVEGVFFRLNMVGDRIAWVYAQGNVGSEYYGYVGNRYVMDSLDAAKYIANEGFTDEECEWLWQFAQMIHVENSEPLERR